MTIIAVFNDEVFVDSCVGWAGASFTTTKIAETPLGKFTGAGNSYHFDEVVSETLRSGELSKYCCHFDSEDSFVIWKANDGTIRLLELKKDRKWTPVYGSAGGLRVVLGSGSPFFMAYYKEHNDVNLAMELTAKHCDTCGLPIERF